MDYRHLIVRCFQSTGTKSREKGRYETPHHIVVCLVATVCTVPFAQVAFSQSTSIVQRQSTSPVCVRLRIHSPSSNKFQIKRLQSSA